VSVRVLDTDDDLLADCSGDAKGPWFALTIEDTGTGMTQEVIGRAFEPFYTTKDVGRGSGLGLSQVYGFVHQSGGFVAIRSALGAGTRMSICLPLSTNVPVSPIDEGAIIHIAQARTERVLLVEDDAAVLALGIEMLSDLGYSVITASDANSALEILRRGERIDIVFSDVVMPGGKSGVQLATEAQKTTPGIKVLLTSGYTGEALLRHTTGEEPVPILAKPYRQQELAVRLREVLDGGALAADREESE
jgi:CheY-like chemotaxis protein